MSPKPRPSDGLSSYPRLLTVTPPTVTAAVEPGAPRDAERGQEGAALLRDELQAAGHEHDERQPLPAERARLRTGEVY